MPHVIEKLQIIREEIGAPLFINSGYRNVTYNASVGGAEHSRHIYGDAVDMDSASATLEELQAICIEQGAAFTSVYESHVHCDWRTHELEPAFYDAALEKQRLSSPHLDAHIVNTNAGLIAPASGFDEGEPLRRWHSYDLSGNKLETHVGSHFVPVVQAVRVTVEVGGILSRELTLP